MQPRGSARWQALLAPHSPALTVLVVGAVAFFAIGAEYRYPATLAVLAIIGAVSMNLLLGYTGLVSLGHAAFIGIGAFITAGLALASVPVVICVGAAILACGVLGGAIAITSLRLRGLYLVMTTFAFHFIVLYVLQRYQLAGHPEGLTVPVASIADVRVVSSQQWYWVALVAATLVVWLSANLVAGRVGRSLLAVRENEALAASQGVPVARTKINVFVLTSMMAGFQGALYAFISRHVEVGTFDLNYAIIYVAAVVLGGSGTLFGPVLGAIFVVGYPYVVQSVATVLPTTGALAALARDISWVNQIIFGLLIVTVLLFEPAGLVGLIRRLAIRAGRAGRRSRPVMA
jgi:branched-chain amino acid transport system permease protein